MGRICLYRRIGIVYDQKVPETAVAMKFQSTITEPVVEGIDDFMALL